jgi:DNA-binding NtrC family response regulator
MLFTSPSLSRVQKFGWASVEDQRLGGRVVLVVEDEPLVGLEVVETLKASDAHVLSACRIADAIALIERHHISAAILDIKLGGEDRSVLCQHLSQRQIPFVFYTGYGTAPGGWHDVPIIPKPVHGTQIVDAVERLCGSHQGAV